MSLCHNIFGRNMEDTSLRYVFFVDILRRSVYRTGYLGRYRGTTLLLKKKKTSVSLMGYFWGRYPERELATYLRNTGNIPVFDGIINFVG